MISIAMATYNGEKFLKEQINSIMNQTYQDFEIIICDDCSKDNTLKILEEMSLNNSKIKVFPNEKNLGFKKNFEKALSLCNGDYIAFSDQDDVWEKNHLEVLINLIGTHDVACANALYVDLNNNSLNHTFAEQINYKKIIPQEYMFLRLFLYYSFVQGASMLLEASFAKKLIPIPEKVTYHDYWFALNSCFSNGIVFSPEIITRYRQHGENVTLSSQKESKFNKIIKIFIKKEGIKTENINTLKMLCEKYPEYETPEFNFVKDFVKRIETKKINFSDFKFLWKVYPVISTNGNHKGFMKRYFTLKNWRDKF